MKMTKQEALKNHRMMWNWIADETLRREEKVQKEDYFEAMGIPIEMRPLSKCYCCDYSKGLCDFCLVIWPGRDEEDNCMNPSGLYDLWCDSTYYKEAAQYARTIANLPEREDVI